MVYFLGDDYMMTHKELIKAIGILRGNNINAHPIEFWESKYYYEITYMTYTGKCYIKGISK